MTFPTTSILDDFNRGDTGPPPSASWVTPAAAVGGLKVISSQLASDDDSYGYRSAWNTAYGPDCEFYATCAAATNGTTQFELYIRMDSNQLANYFTSGDGYVLIVSVNSGGAGAFELDKVSTGVFSTLDFTNLTFVSGDSFGIQMIGSALKAFHKPAAGSWTEILSVTDGTFSGAGYTGLMINDAVGRLDNFGGGTLSLGPVAPTADFSGTPTSGAATLAVDFTDLSTGTPTSWLWDFGDGDTSTSQNPSHSYTFIGVYTVALTATNDQGDDTETKVDYIVVGVAPAADFSGTPTSGDAPLSVDFTDLSTGDVTDWLWDFGDGGSDVIPNATHVYTAAGTYTVALTVTGPAGTDTETKVDYITVTAAAAPVADFSGDTTSGTAPLTVNFTDLSTNTPTSWLWLFGDGASDTAQNPTHIYAYVGTYTVTLTATNAAGSDDEVKIAYITVTAVTEYGAAVVENCDVDTGGLAVGLRVADVAIARDNRLGSVVIDASSELRVKDNSYTTLTNSGTFTSLAGDRSVWDVANFPNAHASDIDGATWVYHLKSATTQAYTISNPATDRAYDVTATTLNEIAAVLGTLIGDLQAKGILG